MHQQQTAFENIVGKGKIACNKQFLLFPQCFLPNGITISPFVHIFDITFLFAAECDKPKIGLSSKGLKYLCHIAGVLRFLAMIPPLEFPKSVKYKVKQIIQITLFWFPAYIVYD